MVAAVIHAQPWEVRQRLALLEIPLEALQKAAEAAFRERALCTENDPPFIRGTEAWRFALRTLREELPLSGDGKWGRVNHGNFALITNHKLKLNILVATGNADTGRLSGWPGTKAPKGLYTQAMVELNMAAISDLFPETIPDEIRQKAKALEYPAWVFLIYTSDGEARAELSFPAAQSEGEITSWNERIIVPGISIEPAKMQDDGRDDDSGGQDFNIEVKLK